MNFDFLKGLRGLGYVYENCNNAEKLAMTMPVQSVFTARKSAELLAKFIYIAAHNENMKSMSFVDILSDPVVCDFINNRNVINAFHYIRKSGNRAVHGDEEETVEEALGVLSDLHYVAGETACIFGLIKKYPSFDSKINFYPEAKFVEDQDIEEKAQQMFLEYVEKYNAQVERDNYYQNNIDNLLEEFNSIDSGYEFVPGEVELNEIIEFKHKLAHESSLKAIQAYFGFLGMRALKSMRGELYGVLEGRKINYSAELTIYGKNGYTTDNLLNFLYGVLKDLPFADGFKIKSSYSGPSAAPWFKANNKERRAEFCDEVTEMGEYENFTYSIYELLLSHGEGYCRKFENGEWDDLKSRYSQYVLDKEYPNGWYTLGVTLAVEFSYEKHPDIQRKLRECVKKYLSDEEYELCKTDWQDEPELLISDIQFLPDTLRTVQNFLDEINSIIEPIKSECSCRADGEWFHCEEPFASAEWNWTDDGFKLTGAEV